MFLKNIPDSGEKEGENYEESEQEASLLMRNINSNFPIVTNLTQVTPILKIAQLTKK